MPKAFKQFVAKIKLPNNIEICFILLFLCLQIMELKAQSKIKVEIDYLSKKRSLLFTDYTMPSTSKTLSPRCKKPD